MKKYLQNSYGMRLAVIFATVHTLIAVFGLVYDARLMKDFPAQYLDQSYPTFPLIYKTMDFPIRMVYTSFGLSECSGTGGPTTWCSILLSPLSITIYLFAGAVFYAMIGYIIGKVWSRP